MCESNADFTYIFMFCEVLIEDIRPISEDFIPVLLSANVYPLDENTGKIPIPSKEANRGDCNSLHSTIKVS